jgi:two-component system phosphate regulon sensor histidine kinase PhoR
MSASHDLNWIIAIPLPILVICADERLLGLNRPAQRIFGADAAGRHYITALRQPDLLDAIEQTLQTGTPGTTRYLGRSADADTTYDVTVNASDGHVVVTLTDMTALEAAGQMRRDFVANVSHELRTVDDLLSLTRVEADERLRPSTLVDLGGLVTAVTDLLAPVAAVSAVHLRPKLPDRPVVVPGDGGQLQQVLSNLIENAIKYGVSGGYVDITLTEPGTEPTLRATGVRLSVVDYGEGIAAHHIPRLTERFYRIDPHRSREVGGTGLGLAIVKHIVNRHRGRLRIDSDVGQGTRVTVILPVG